MLVHQGTEIDNLIDRIIEGQTDSQIDIANMDYTTLASLRSWRKRALQGTYLNRQILSIIRQTYRQILLKWIKGITEILKKKSLEMDASSSSYRDSQID